MRVITLGARDAARYGRALHVTGARCRAAWVRCCPFAVALRCAVSARFLRGFSPDIAFSARFLRQKMR
eukprot:1050525-Rhodomonas_salina.1